MPITVTEPGPDGTLQTVAEPPPDAAPPPGEGGTPGDSAPPAPDAAAPDATRAVAPSESAPEAPESPETPEDEDDDEAPSQTPTPRSVQRRIDRERRLRADAERKAAAAEARARMFEEGYRKPQPEPTPVPLHEQPAPRNVDYASEEEWLTARDEWLEARVMQKVAQQQYEQTVRQQQAERERQMVEQAQTARQKYSDFDTVLDRLSAIYTAPALDACVHESELGAELAYYLAQHPDEITRLNQVAQTAPLAMAREIGKLEMRLSPTNGTTSRPNTPTPKPAPPTPLTGAGSQGPRRISTMSNEEVEAMSQKEFEALGKVEWPNLRW
jgi:hypothetical protein